MDRGDHPGHPLGVGDGQILGEHLPHNHVRRDDQPHRHHERDCVKHPAGKLNKRLDGRFDQRRNHRLCHIAQAQRRHGDAELGTDELRLQVLDGFEGC